MEHGGEGDTNLCAWNNLQRLGRGEGRIRNRQTSQDHQNYRIVEIGRNIENHPGVLRRLAVTQTLLKDQQLWSEKLASDIY